MCPKSPPNNCREKDIVYEGKITINDSNETKTYKGCTSDELKNRIRVHRNTFRDVNKKNNTEMAKEVHKIKETTENFEIEWNVIDRATSFKAGDKFCKLCTLEKYHILLKKKESDLNKFRLEKCRHKKKHHLSDIT